MPRSQLDPKYQGSARRESPAGPLKDPLDPFAFSAHVCTCVEHVAARRRRTPKEKEREKESAIGYYYHSVYNSHILPLFSLAPSSPSVISRRDLPRGPEKRPYLSLSLSTSSASACGPASPDLLLLYLRIDAYMSLSSSSRGARCF